MKNTSLVPFLFKVVAIIVFSLQYVSPAKGDLNSNLNSYVDTIQRNDVSYQLINKEDFFELPCTSDCENKLLLGIDINDTAKKSDSKRDVSPFLNAGSSGHIIFPYFSTSSQREVINKTVKDAALTSSEFVAEIKMKNLKDKSLVLISDVWGIQHNDSNGTSAGVGGFLLPEAKKCKSLRKALTKEGATNKSQSNEIDKYKQNGCDKRIVEYKDYFEALDVSDIVHFDLSGDLSELENWQRKMGSVQNYVMFSGLNRTDTEDIYLEFAEDNQQPSSILARSTLFKDVMSSSDFLLMLENQRIQINDIDGNCQITMNEIYSKLLDKDKRKGSKDLVDLYASPSSEKNAPFVWTINDVSGDLVHKIFSYKKEEREFKAITKNAFEYAVVFNLSGDECKQPTLVESSGPERSILAESPYKLGLTDGDSSGADGDNYGKHVSLNSVNESDLHVVSDPVAIDTVGDASDGSSDNVQPAAMSDGSSDNVQPAVAVGDWSNKRKKIVDQINDGFSEHCKGEIPKLQNDSKDGKMKLDSSKCREEFYDTLDTLVVNGTITAQDRERYYLETTLTFEDGTRGKASKKSWEAMTVVIDNRIKDCKKMGASKYGVKDCTVEGIVTKPSQFSGFNNKKGSNWFNAYDDVPLYSDVADKYFSSETSTKVTSVFSKHGLRVTGFAANSAITSSGFSEVKWIKEALDGSRGKIYIVDSNGNPIRITRSMFSDGKITINGREYKSLKDANSFTHLFYES